MATENKINWQTTTLFVIGALLTMITALTGLIYQNNLKTSENISSLLKEHSDKISAIELKVAVIEQQIFFINTEKKNRVACNFKQWLFVNNCSEKKKRKDVYDCDDEIPLFV
jgi:hypothetical protein